MERTLEKWAHIGCLDRWFSAEEWAEWIKIHPTDEVVFQYKEFGFNTHDVCLTPHITPIYEGTGRRRWEIRTAQSPNGRWTEGNYTGYGSSPVMFCYHAANGYATEREAIYAGLLYIERGVKSKIKRLEAAIGSEACRGDHNQAASYKSDLKEQKKVLAAIAVCKDRHDPKQLTLFDL